MDSDDDYEESSESSYRGVPATIILINVLDVSTAEKAHAATCRLIRRYLRQSRSQYVSVCLFGTEIDDDESSTLRDKNITDLFPLTMLSLEDYNKLQAIKIASVKKDTQLKMLDVLLHCSRLFVNCKKQLRSRTVIMLQKLDSPPIDQMPALKQVQELAESNVDIRLININDTDSKADEFYENFLINAYKSRDVIVPKAVWSVEEIEKLMYQQSHRHLAVAKLCFEIGNGISIGVGVYNLLKDSRQTLKTTYLDSETNVVVTPVTEILKKKVPTDSPMECDEEENATTVPLLKSELIYYQEYGGDRVEFTDSEMRFLKNPFGPPMLKLIGFKPASSLIKEKCFLKKGYFLFPNEQTIEGSTIAFKALHQACFETGMLAICIMCTRVNSKPFNVALSPSTHPLGLDIDTGFDVIIIPFVENVRDMPEMEDEEINISTGHKTVMKDTIKAVLFDYKADMFEDPKVQSLYRNIEAFALNDEDIEPFVDTTKPKSEMFSDLDDELFQEIFGLFGSAAIKRGTSSDNRSAKRVKTEDIDESLIESRVASKQVDKFTVPQLREILKSRSAVSEMPALTGLKKPQLVDLVYKSYK